jgi:hypothetical protein
LLATKYSRQNLSRSSGRPQAGRAADLDDAAGWPLSAGISRNPRQSGRLLDLGFNPEFASEVTLQPIRRFNFDAAIIFEHSCHPLRTRPFVDNSIQYLLGQLSAGAAAA